MIRVAVAGARGRMGSVLVRSISDDEKMNLVAAFDMRDIGEHVSDNVKVSHPDDMDAVLKETSPDVFVDFTNADAAVRNVRIAADNRIKIVVGTTGFTDEQFNEMKSAIIRNKIPAVISPNFSVGVNVFWKLVEYAVRYLSDYHVEIIEMHHSLKKDAPSGTALKAAEIIREHMKSIGRRCELVYGRKGIVGERSHDEIGIHAVRAADIVGEHTTIFASAGERIEITHRAHSREAFAKGTLRAIEWVHKQTKSGIYGMDDVLGF
ncbi:4-hydroxy-tetrahydrodipicolinate reductase [Methanosarcinales archaeon]|nr:MAG: 4-hydroxy-tetrahydrodipicolinate reductase [Methanosarcinales archaeon]